MIVCLTNPNLYLIKTISPQLITLKLRKLSLSRLSSIGSSQNPTDPYEFNEFSSSNTKPFASPLKIPKTKSITSSSSMSKKVSIEPKTKLNQQQVDQMNALDNR